MKSFETKSGQIFEMWESRKEALHDVADIIDSIRYANEIGQRTDDYLWIQYKDGSHYCISEEGEEGKFKKINIEAIIDENTPPSAPWTLGHSRSRPATPRMRSSTTISVSRLKMDHFWRGGI